MNNTHTQSISSTEIQIAELNERLNETVFPLRNRGQTLLFKYAKRPCRALNPAKSMSERNAKTMIKGSFENVNQQKITIQIDLIENHGFFQMIKEATSIKTNSESF